VALRNAGHLGRVGDWAEMAAEAGPVSATGHTGGAAGSRGNGMLSFYVDPKAVDPEAMLPADVARYVAFLKSAGPAIPGGEILLPGEPERRTRERRLKDGVPLPDDTWASIVAAAREVGVDERRIQEAGA
jgi:hydroxycarboxylate dehydrogenase B